MSATQPLASGVEVVLPLDSPLDPLSPQRGGPPLVTAAADEPPSFTLGLQNQTVTSGDAAVFTVMFRGQPTPTVQWSIDGRLVHSTRVDEVTSSVDGVEIVEDLERGTSTLTVLSTSDDSEAQYTCRVQNHRGTACTNAHLFVLGISLF